MNYFKDKEKLAEQARIHTAMISNRYKDQTNKCIEDTKIYSPDYNFYYNSKAENQTPKIIVEEKDSVSSLMSNITIDKLCILNFASYKNPGGKFIDGSSAQEESLCHASNLYNILSAFDSTYYEWNRHNLNKALYLNRALYTPNVMFMNPNSNEMVYADVLTCAAPNIGPGLKYGTVTEEENHKALYSRIQFVLDIMNENNVDIAILGAYGCGVFKQDPTEVAHIFANLLSSDSYNFKKVIFAIPGGINYKEFNSILG